MSALETGGNAVVSLVIGHSVENRQLTVTRVGFGKGTACVLVGAVHGEEVNTFLCVDALREKYAAHPELVPGSFTLFFLPALNPDGIAVKRRLNSHEVDLNRNFPSKDWLADAFDMKRTVKGFGGTGPASEPEVRAFVVFLLETVKPDFEEVRVMAFHSAAPPVGYMQPGHSSLTIPHSNT